MRLRSPLLLVALLVLPCGASRAAAQASAEHDVKAAFVFNFAGFTEWPGGASNEALPLVTCVSAASALRAPLESLAGQRIKHRRFEVRVPASLEEFASCNVVVVDAADRPRIPLMLRALAGRSVLTIGEAPDSHRDGLVVSLAIEENRLRFRVNLKAARLAQLEISSKLLRLAQAVE